MSESSYALYVAELASILRRLLYLRGHLKLVLPEDLAASRAQLDESHPEGMTSRAADYSLLFNIGIILARQQGAMTMGELARSLEVPLSTATRIVDWLVRSGYAERQPDPDDRRVVRVALTDKGQATCQASGAFVRRRLEKWLRRLTPEECENLVVLLRKLVQALEAEL